MQLLSQTTEVRYIWGSIETKKAFRKFIPGEWRNSSVLRTRCTLTEDPSSVRTHPLGGSHLPLTPAQGASNASVLCLFDQLSVNSLSRLFLEGVNFPPFSCNKILCYKQTPSHKTSQKVGNKRPQGAQYQLIRFPTQFLHLTLSDHSRRGGRKILRARGSGSLRLMWNCVS